MKKKGICIIKDKKEIMEFKAYLDSLDVEYQMIVTNYTVKFVCLPLGISLTLTNTIKSNYFFAVSKKLEKEVKEFLDLVPEIGTINYYRFNKAIETLTTEQTFFCVDIKGAYPKTLLNNNLISTRTYEMLNSLPKIEKLACIGILASEKEVYTIKDSEVMELEFISKNTKKVFYYCVTETTKAISRQSRLYKDNFLFYWVDGIFINDPFVAKIIQDNLLKDGYESSLLTCKSPKIETNEKGKILEFWEEAKDGNQYTKKTYNIPAHYGTMKSDIKNMINENF